MYEALVARVRYHIQKANFMGLKEAESTLLLGEAADAIERLDKDLERSKEYETFWEKEANEALKKFQATVASMPRWIPVTERLPEKTNHYLVHVKCGCDGKFASAWEQVAWFCEKFYWEHQHGDDVFKETITHWMPLPEPPKEET